jgi:hypothetical protein
LVFTESGYEAGIEHGSGIDDKKKLTNVFGSEAQQD